MTVDVARYRIYHIKKKLKGLLEDEQETIPSYMCTKCTLRYSAFDVIYLLNETDDNFHCEKCNTILIAERAAMKEEDEAHRLLLERVEQQLKPLTDQLALLKDLSPPEYVSLQAWEARYAVHIANESQGKTLPSIKEEKVETAENSKGNDAANVKFLPPWMIKQGMNLTNEQHGEVKGNPKDEKATNGPQTNNAEFIEKEYIKAYQAQLMNMYQSEYSKVVAEDASTERQSEYSKVVAEDASTQHQSEYSKGVAEDASIERSVGQKAKREESDEEESDELDPFATGGVESETIDKESKGKTPNGSDVEDALKDYQATHDKEDGDDNDDEIIWE